MRGIAGAMRSEMVGMWSNAQECDAMRLLVKPLCRNESSRERMVHGISTFWTFVSGANNTNTLLRYTVCQQHTVVYDWMRLAECYCASVAKKCSLWGANCTNRCVYNCNPHVNDDIEKGSSGKRQISQYDWQLVNGLPHFSNSPVDVQFLGNLLHGYSEHALVRYQMFTRSTADADKPARRV